jgi:hypothetical protein
MLTLRDSCVHPAVGVVAEQKREAIPRRTRVALAAARARGVKLRQSNGAAALRRAGRGAAPLRAAIAQNADQQAEDLRAVVEDVRAGGAIRCRILQRP